MHLNLRSVLQWAFLIPAPLEGSQFVSQAQKFPWIPMDPTTIWAVLHLCHGRLISEAGTGSPAYSSAFFWNPQVPPGESEIPSSFFPCPRMPFPPNSVCRISTALQQVLGSPDQSRAGPSAGCCEYGDYTSCIVQNSSPCLCDILSHFVIKFYLRKYGLCNHDILKSKEEAGC